jgi:hypothetical protein
MLYQDRARGMETTHARHLAHVQPKLKLAGEAEHAPYQPHHAYINAVQLASSHSIDTLDALMYC